MITTHWIKENGSTFILGVVLVALTLFSLVEPNLDTPFFRKTDKVSALFENSKMIRLKNGQPVLEIKSARANVFDSQQRIVFFNATGKYFDDNTTVLRLNAPMAELNQQSSKIMLIDCQLDFKVGVEDTVIHSDYLSWDIAKSEFIGFQKTVIESKSIIVEGDRVVFSFPVKRFTVSGNGILKVKHAI